jgi:ankyrin repeat protein
MMAERRYRGQFLADIRLLDSMLLDLEADIDSKSLEGRTPLSYAAASGRASGTRAIKLLANVDKRNWTPMSYVEEKGNEKVVEILKKALLSSS